MLFNSIDFLFFLPAVLIGTSLVRDRWRNHFLLGVCYFFYSCWDWRFLGLLWLSTLIDFWAGHRIHEAQDTRTRKLALVVSVCANLTILGFFKYFDFFAGSAQVLLESVGIHASLPTLSIILPVGISFYTFQSMSYTIDIYRGEATPAAGFLEYAVYVAYFPQLVAGPIERVKHLLPQIRTPARVTAERVNIGLTLMMLGYVKKVLIADQLAPVVDRIFADPTHLSSGVLLKGLYFFAFQIYCDFSGYTDIARGVSELFGIRLRLNFNQPYLSQSITEFWRRWHMSLSTWLRDYLYIPLGGNRHGKWNTYRNLMLTMLLGGLWHGANWTFVVWGAVHGVWLALERLLGIGRGVASALTSAWSYWAQRGVRTLVTFHVVLLGWVLFRAPSFQVASEYLVGILRFTNLTAVGFGPLIVAAAILAIDIPQNYSGDHVVFLRIPWWFQSPVYASLCLAFILYGGANIPFIYFQF
ncbi:MAG: MBOAT family O-acyltransferase [Candidatus Binatia bacterium]